MSAVMNKFSQDGYEIGASKIGVIVLGKNNFYVREYLRYQFRKIQLGEIDQMDSTSAPNAAKRGQYLEPGLREWVSDELDELCSQQEGQMSCNLYIPKEGFHKKEYKMAASLDGILEIKGGVLPFYDRLEDKMVNLEGFGVCEIKTQGYNSGPPTYENILQVQAQMFCSGYKWAIIGKLGPNLKFDMYVYEEDKEIQNTIVEAVKDFWKRVEDDIPYDDDSEPEKTFVDWTNHSKSNEVMDLITDFNNCDQKIKEQKELKESAREKIIGTLKSENVSYIIINDKKVALDTIVRKATPEKIVPAKPESQYEKLTVKEMKDE